MPLSILGCSNTSQWCGHRWSCSGNHISGDSHSHMFLQGTLRRKWKSSIALQPWESGARLSLIGWPCVSGGQPFQGIPIWPDLYHPGCPRAGQHSLTHGGTHRPGDIGRRLSPSLQLLTLSASMYPLPRWECRESVESQRNWWGSSLGQFEMIAPGQTVRWKGTRPKSIN